MLIDLSVVINENTPGWPGDPQVEVKSWETFEKDDCEDQILTLGNHTGTHIDAPSHMIPGSKNLNDFPLNKFTGRGVCIKVSGEFNLEEIKSAEINEGDIVLFDTGTSKKLGDESYFEDYPVMPKKIADYLVEKKVKLVGLDTPSIDKTPFTNHQILLGAEVLIIENLTNLSLLEGKNFKIYAFPLKLELDGSPVRVVAEVLAR